MYYIYTEENVYVFNAKYGSYAKRIYLTMYILYWGSTWFFNVIIQ